MTDVTKSRSEETWLPLARPVVSRLDHTWRDEDAVLANLAEAPLRLLGADKLGFVERRRHWLTRRTQLRLTAQARCSNKLAAELGRAGRVA